MKKEREEILRWFVDFANMDLVELKLGDKAKLSFEAEEYLFPHWEKHVLNQFAASEAKSLTTFAALHFMEWVSRPPQDLNEPQYWERMSHFQSIIRNTLGMNEDHHKKELFWQGNTIFHWVEDLNGKYSLSWVPFYRSEEDYIATKLYSLLDGLPSKTVYQCLGCKKYSVNFTLRKKQFCSPRCMWRFNTAKRREADRDGYRKYQKELMKDRRREKKNLPRKKTKSRKAKKRE